jgi:hypothetical protein
MIFGELTKFGLGTGLGRRRLGDQMFHVKQFESSIDQRYQIGTSKNNIFLREKSPRFAEVLHRFASLDRVSPKFKNAR